MKVVLAICGGGMRGLIPGRILEEFETQLNCKITDAVDLVAGTSTGGILSCLITSPARHSAKSLRDFYFKDGPKIFASDPLRKLYTAFSALHSKFRNTALVDCLASYMTGGFIDQSVMTAMSNNEKVRFAQLARSMGHYVGPYSMSQAVVPTLITSYDKNTPGPLFMKSYDPYWAEFPMASAAAATASAPTYFPSFDFTHRDQKYALIDGGVFANNPAMCALADAYRLWGREEDVMLINLDTGTLKNQRDSKKITANGGLASWAPVITEVCMDGSHDTAAYQALQVLGEDRFFHFQVTLDKMYPMDDASKSTLTNYVDSTEAALSSYLYEPMRKAVELIKFAKK